MDKPRHQGETGLIARVLATGAAVHTPAGGDVAGGLEALLPDGHADLLLGIGGTPEGVMTAAAVRALGGGMLGRLAPKTDEEADAIRGAGMSVDRIYERDELVGGARCSPPPASAGAHCSPRRGRPTAPPSPSRC